MNPAYDHAEELEGERGNDLAARRGEYEEELGPLDISELDALSLLYAKMKNCESCNGGATVVTYEEWPLGAFSVLGERILNAYLGQEHLLRRIVRRVLHDFQVLPNYNEEEKN